MRILGLPARRNRDRNPFNFLLSEALAAQGAEVADFDDWKDWSGGWDVVHIHWPQQAARGGKRRALGKSLGLLTRLAFLRLRGARLVWTVHNVRGHDSDTSAIERVLMECVVRLVHGAVFLTESSRVPAYKELPALAAKPAATIPHGLYRETSDKSQKEARVAFGLPQDRPVVGFLGDIKKYKGLDVLLDAFGETTPGASVLFIAGEFQKFALASQGQHSAEARRKIADLRAAGHAIVFHEARLDDDALADAVRACDLVALPYREIWNSGLALFVVQNGSRVLASNAAAFRELQEELGDGAIALFEGRLTGNVLASTLADKSHADADRLAAFRAARAWPKIASATMAFYEALGAGKQSSSSPVPQERRV